jgi:hypothetical protein
MRKRIVRVSVGLAAPVAIIAIIAIIAAAPAPVRADVVADYHDDFTYSAPAPGWSYLWNKNGPIGTAANYVPLVADAAASGRYETEDNTPDAFPDAAPGSSASATNTTLIPGQGGAQNALERYVIAGYTISAADIASNGEQLVLDLYSFTVPLTSEDGITAKVYKNDILFIDRQLPPGTVFTYQTPDPNGGPIPLGPFAAGDTLFVAIGSNGIAPFGNGTDAGDALLVDYSLVLVPEPTTSVAGIISLGLLLARRLRRGRGRGRWATARRGTAPAAPPQS